MTSFSVINQVDRSILYRNSENMRGFDEMKIDFSIETAIFLIRFDDLFYLFIFFFFKAINWGHQD